MRKLALISVAILLVSCNPFISKDLRKKNRCNKKLERVVKKCPELLSNDTIIDTIRVEIPKVEIDTSFQILVDSSSVDSLLLEIEQLETREQKITYLKEYIPKYVVLDTLIEKDGFKIGIIAEDGEFSISIRRPKEEIEVLDTDIVPVVKEIELKWYEKILLVLGKYFNWICIIGAILFILYWVYRFLKRGVK